MYIGVEDFRFEEHFRRHDRVLRTETNFDEEDEALVWGIFGAFDEGFP